MSKESFQYPETQQLFRHIENVSQRSGVSRAAAFEDFLQASVSALGHPLMDDEYLETIEKHKEGTKGKRGVDSLAAAFATLVDISESGRDVLGDLFQSSITYGERGQFMTPEPIAEMVSKMNLPEKDTGLDGRRTVADPCCGSGRMLMAAAAIQPHWHFFGQDVDRRCVLMCSINLSLRNRYGHVVWGDSLKPNDRRLIYETGRVQIWGNAIRKVNHVPLPSGAVEQLDNLDPVSNPTTSVSESETATPKSQLYLF
ncbi:MAG: SAM-dependent DNA methyltransferase [Planctomycetaceae bacterium]|nr:SAM-dependent DNA methyltransferase [Planctomycetaceae bacterium]